MSGLNGHFKYLQMSPELYNYSSLHGWNPIAVLARMKKLACKSRIILNQVIYHHFLIYNSCSPVLHFINQPFALNSIPSDHPTVPCHDLPRWPQCTATPRATAPRARSVPHRPPQNSAANHPGGDYGKGDTARVYLGNPSCGWKNPNRPLLNHVESFWPHWILMLSLVNRHGHFGGTIPQAWTTIWGTRSVELVIIHPNIHP